MYAIRSYYEDKSSDDILVRGSAGPSHNRVVAIKAACDLKTEDLVCLRLLPDSTLMIDKWEYGQEAVGAVFAGGAYNIIPLSIYPYIYLSANLSTCIGCRA